MKYIILLNQPTMLCLLLAIIFPQTNQDARMLGLNGSYTTLASGYRAVGVNPANLAAYQNKSWNIFNFSLGLSNNFLSIENYNILSGAHLDDSTCICFYPKELILSEFGGKGLRIMQSLNIPFPLNMSTRRFAFSSKLSSNIDIGLPEGMIRLLFEGNTFEKDLVLDIEEFIILSHETSVSYGHSFSGYSAGISLKYLLGLFYLGMEPVSSTSITTDPLGFIGNPQYIIQQAIGGSGIGLDIGITTDETKEGYRFGMSVINILGKIKWAQDHFMRTSLENTMKNSAGDFYLRPNEFMLVNLVIDSVTATAFSNTSGDPLIYYGMYKVIPLDNIIDTMVSQDSGLVVKLENETFLFPSGGKYSQKIILGGGDEQEKTLTDNYTKYAKPNANPFTTRHPVYLRLGVSKRWKGQAAVVADLVTGFSDRFGSNSAWRLSLGTEIVRFNNKVFRLGYAFGGIAEKSMSIGYGTKLGNLRFDIGLSLNGGFSLDTAKGCDLAVGIVWQPG